MTNWRKLNEQPVDTCIMYFIEDNPNTELYLTRFCAFASERQAVFNRKQAGATPPWTLDTVLANHKFTNCYRVLDRVSQYLIREIINPAYESDVGWTSPLFCKIYLFKLFNKIETWEAIPPGYLVTDNSFYMVHDILGWARNHTEPLFSNAYVYCTSDSKYDNRIDLYFAALNKMLADDAPNQIHNMFMTGKNNGFADVFEYLRGFYGFGDFLAYQFAIDFSYAMPVQVNLNNFVVPGPGCIRGMEKVFGDKLLKSQMPMLLKEMTYHQRGLFEMCDVPFPWVQIDGGYEGLALNDFQNMFCEFDKYSRSVYPDMNVASSKRKKIKTAYRAEYCKPIEPIVLPWSWNH